MTKQELDRMIAAKKKYPKAGRRVLAKEAGVSQSMVQRWLKKNMAGVGVKPSSVKKAVAPSIEVKKVKTLSDFRNTYDKATIVPAKVKAALKVLGASGWEYEVAFVKLAGVSLMDLALFREEFAPYIVNLKDNKRAWAGSTKTATTMREML